MEKNIFFLLYHFADLLLLLTFLFWIWTCAFKTKPFRFIFYYLTSALIILSVKELMNFGVFKQFNWLMLIFSFLHLLFLGLFLLRNPVSLSNWVVYFFSTLVFLNLLVIFFDVFNNTWYSASFANVSLIIFCALSYNKLFRGSNTIENASKSSIMILNGIFLSTTFCTPVILFSKYLGSILNEQQYYLVACMGPISSVILYLFIFNSARCLKRAPK
jgi:hypothetical protein